MESPPSDMATPSPPPTSNSGGTPGTKIPKPSLQPRKGILKRSGSVSSPKSPLSDAGTDGGDSDFVVRRGSLRALPWAPASAVPSPGSHSKIPKLSVTWWETSSAYGDTPSRNRRAKSNTPPRHVGHEHVHEIHEELDDADDTESVQSCGSSIAGTWWFGRQTKYVPHCDKRHLHLEDTEQYLTPTQRKNREIAELKKQLKLVNKTVEEKDAHLTQLRDKMSELERIMDQGGALSENHRLLAKLNLAKEESDREKCNLVNEFEIRFRKFKTEHLRDSAEREASLQFELDELRSKALSGEFSSAPKVMEDSDSGISRSLISEQRILTTEDRCTMTDLDGEPWSGQVQQELQAFKYENALLRNRVSELDYSLKQFEKELDNEEQCDNKNCATRQRAMSAHLEAYKNECLVWRTKSAEMEIALKQQTNVRNSLEQQIQNYEQQLKHAKMTAAQQSAPNGKLGKRNSIDETKFRSNMDFSDEGFLGDSDLNEDTKKVIQNEFISMKNRIRRLESQLDDAKMQLQSDNQRKENISVDYNELVDESTKLSLENENLMAKLKSFERQLDESRRAANDKEELLKTSEQVLLNIDSQLASKRTELEVMQLSCQKLRDENDKIISEKISLEEKIHNLENTMADCGVIIGPAANLRRKMSRASNAQQTVYRARDVQTDLNWQDELQMENDLKDLRERRSVLERKYDDETSDLSNRVDEITASLMLKNSLVTTLTNQIQLLQAEIAAVHEGFDRERFMNNQKMHEVNLIAQRVPFLEQDVNTAREELRAIEKEYNKERDRFEKTLENSVSDVVKSQQDTSLYYRQRLENAEKMSESFKKKLEDCRQELSDERMRSTLRNVELERQLESNLGEVQRLQTKIFANRRNVEIQVEPSTAEKSVLCYVRTTNKCTEVAKGDLYDERDEQLKVLQGELLATRRQVEVLQDKLLVQNILQQQLSDVETRKQELTSRCLDLQKHVETLTAERKIERDDFDLKYKSVMEEKERMAREEKDRYHRLEAEFDNVRQEMDDVIKRYETKKAEMKSKLETLEKESEDRKRLEMDVRDLKADLDQLEVNYEREKFELLKKENELAALRDKISDSVDLLAKKTADHQQETDLFVDLSGLEKQIEEMTAECGELRETDILDSTSDLRSISTVGADEYIPILAFSKKSDPTNGSSLIGDEIKSITKSPDMVSARDSLSMDDVDGGSTLKKIEDENTFDTDKFEDSLFFSLNNDDASSEDRQELVDSIQAQTHLLQSLRAELEEEQKKHKDVKLNLYERIQKLAAENAVSIDETSTPIAGRSEIADYSVVPEVLVNLVKENAAKTPSLRQAVVDVKAKVLYLMHENQELRSDMKELKRSVSILINRRDIAQLRKPKNDDTIPSVTLNDEEIYSSPDEEEHVETVVDLNGLRNDLNQIVARFDLTSQLSDEREKEEAILMKWLKHELAKEKCELDVLVKWYETDKAKLELQLTDYKIRLESAECERDFFKRKFDKTHDQLNDIGRELHFYKEEDSFKYINDTEKRALTKFHSDSALCPSSIAARKRSFKEKLRRTTKDLFGLERKFAGMEKERREVKQELDMLRGELVMVQLQYDTDKDYWSHGQNSVMSQSVVSYDEAAQTETPITFDVADDQQTSSEVSNLSPKDFDDLKKELYHAEQCAARLDSEAAQWQSELVALKLKLKKSDPKTDVDVGGVVDELRRENQTLKSKLAQFDKMKEQETSEFEGQMSNLREQLKQAEQNSVSLENEVAKYGEQCIVLKEQMEATVAKQQLVIERQKSELDSLKSHHKRDSALKQSPESSKVENIDIHEKTSTMIDDESISETETVVQLIADSEQYVTDVINDDSNLISVAKQADEVRRKYEAEIANLLNQIEFQKQNQSAKVVSIKNEVEKTLTSLAENLRASNEEVLSIKEQYEVVIDNLQKKLESERFRLSLFEEKAAHFEREFKMVTKELELRCKSFESEKETFEKENANLRKRLYSAALSIEVAEKSMDVENALDTAHELQDKLAALMAEMEEKEKKHQEMYAVMFQKGQNAARAELFSSGMDTASSSSTEWIFESGLGNKISSVECDLPQQSQQQQPSASSTVASTTNAGDVESRIQNELDKRKESGDSKLNEDEVRLRFLRDAVYYYLLGRDTKDHLQAIMSILKFSERQRHDVIKLKSLS